uniref:AAA+ ATPase domain-containing protein n=1 Tax=viral metagenome TaxID=1070528 RepID=A0A6C0EG75_9ZZZZ
MSDLLLLFLLPICVAGYTFKQERASAKAARKLAMIHNVFDFENHPGEMIRKFYGTSIGVEWSYSEFMNNIKEDNIGAVSFLADKNHAIAIDNILGDDGIIESTNLHNVQILPDSYQNMLDAVTDYNINTDMLPVPINPLSELIGTMGKLFVDIGGFIFMYLLFTFIVNNISGRNGGNPMNMITQQFNENTGTLVNANNLNVTFADVAGCDEAKFELTEVVDFLKNSTKYDIAGAKVPRGILLEGSPGTGKTLLARAVASEAGVPFLSVSGSEFIEMFVGVGAARVRSLFERARANAPCVIFIDEIDAIGRQRGAGIAGGNDEREQTLNQILTNMDGFEQGDNIVILAATNRIDILDNALTRPGRFDRKVSVPLPDYDGRIQIAKVHFKDKQLDESVDFEELASLTPGFSGADIANLANEAAIVSIRFNRTSIDRTSLLDAYEKITIGLNSYSQETDESIIELVSYHETGHALMAALFPAFFDVRKVTINANKNGAGGYTLFTPKERFQKYATKKFMLANLIIALGGRAAEVHLNRQKYNASSFDSQIFRGFHDLDITTGASNDLFQANKIARDYITRYGFGEDFGMYDESSNDELPFVGKEMGMSSRKMSDSTKYDVDQQVKHLVNFAYKRSYELITIYKDAFGEIVEELTDKRVISGIEITNIINKEETEITIEGE